MRRTRLIALLVLVCACSPMDQSAELAEPRSVKLFEVTRDTRSAGIVYPATIRSVRTTDLAFQVSGRIIELNALEGRIFARGDVIARIDPRSFQNAVTQAQAEYDNAQSEYDRALRLIDEDAISQSVLEGRLAERRVAQAQLDSAKKDLADTVIRAPFAGSVGKTYVEQFQSIQAQSPVLTLQSRQVEAIIDVPGRFVADVPKIRKINAVVELDAVPGREMVANFREASGQADSSTQTFQAHFTFSPPADVLILNGMTARLRADVQLFDQARDDATALRVPLNAIFTSDNKKYVWVMASPEMTISRREVEVAESFGDLIEISSGLEEGDTIVATGGGYLNQGDAVRPWSR